MTTYTFNSKTYDVDSEGFLLNFNTWDEDFATGTAHKIEISQLTKDHWDVIYAIRNFFLELGRCPLVYQVCRKNGLHLKDLRTLFPNGYLRGACRISGITYKEGYLKYSYLMDNIREINAFNDDKIYATDVRGFLVNSSEWDENFAVHKAFEMKMPENLTEKHWKIIRFLRENYEKNKVVATIYETCEANKIEIDELEQLFPDGYHRGAVKISGLRVR
ncbi:MAG: hypothetical protein A2161_08510 [Candidatus Schekmanbacteria bacterium RBG_13_48_7]|uniref:Sulfurtransferase TusE n=1 Tax=Candidatus Schekmanbacteria bacterium RBG_13_48_7 TaxID=1817878 RepID=A0A1F7RVV6_9BACT|nr:MAG: hypothetical protein A2161_08510 [Candidatus Schekmanbacteria bacterium RBG_13_48_7]